MKERFTTFDIPTVPYQIIDRADAPLNFPPPYVVKPLDSQGQRGIYRLESVDAVRSHFQKVLHHSRTNEILVEAFYPSTEVTVSGWVQAGEVHVFTITDRVTFAPEHHIGVCTAHEYPSIHIKRYGETLEALTARICKVFEIDEGPIYFQFLIGAAGICVNEIACRLGGAYEDLSIPWSTGIDILDLQIRSALGQVISKEALTPKYAKENRYFSTQLFFCKPGKIVDMTPLETLKASPYILDAGYNFKLNDSIESIENASQRAGFAIVTGQTESEIQVNIDAFFSTVKIRDENGENLIIKKRRNR